MQFEVARRRLLHLPDVPPPLRPEMEATVLARGTPLAGERRTVAGPGRDAAALALLFPDARGEAHIVLTVRSSGNHIHASQVSLPGGKREPGDTFPEGTALREASEEIGLDAQSAGLTVIGVLPSVDVRVSGFTLVPVLALAEARPSLRADPSEVAEILLAPVRLFLPGAPVERVEEMRDGWRLRYGAFPVLGYRVWGATGRIMDQLGAVLGTD